MCIKNQLSRQTGSRNLTGPKTLPTIWYTYMTLVTKYQISANNSYWEKCDEKYLGRTEGQRDWGKTVYLPPPSESGGIKILYNFTSIFSTRFFNQMIDIQGPSWSYCSWIYDYLCNQCLSPVTLGINLCLYLEAIFPCNNTGENNVHNLYTLNFIFWPSCKFHALIICRKFMWIKIK
jgi:hypothetical protein